MLQPGKKKACKSKRAEAMDLRHLEPQDRHKVRADILFRAGCALRGTLAQDR